MMRVGTIVTKMKENFRVTTFIEIPKLNPRGENLADLSQNVSHTRILNSIPQPFF